MHDWLGHSRAPAPRYRRVAAILNSRLRRDKHVSRKQTV
jgi:hypothetical protein